MSEPSRREVLTWTAPAVTAVAAAARGRGSPPPSPPTTTPTSTTVVSVPPATPVSTQVERPTADSSTGVGRLAYTGESADIWTRRGLAAVLAGAALRLLGREPWG